MSHLGSLPRLLLHTPDASTVTPPLPAESGTLSGWLRRFGFRFFAVYLLLYNLPGLPGWIPGLRFVSGLNHDLWQKVVPWAGREILHLEKPIATQFNGSGDMTYHYVQFLCLVLAAWAGALAWVWFDRRRRHDPFVRDAVRTVVRYALGITMLSYGMSKMLHQQMPAPMLHQLVTPYSEFSPMGLLWRFMGYSATYSFFAGFSEFAGGMLLFFRRTTTLGALILSAVMFHVVLMNFCFDVPVKLYSTHLFLFAVFLAAPDLGRLADLLIWHRAVPAVPFVRAWPRAWMRYGALALKVLLLACVAWQIPVARTLAWAKNPPPPELQGVYEVRDFRNLRILDEAAAHPDVHWRRLTITAQGVKVELTNNKQTFYRTTGSIAGRKLTFTTYDPPAQAMDFTVERPQDGQLTVAGAWDGRDIAATLVRVDDKFPLLNRGFRWINESPYNR